MPLKFRRTECRGIFLVRTSQVTLRATYSVKKPWRAFCARVILAYGRLTRQEPLGSLQNSHFAAQNRASCGLPLSHPHHRTGPEKTPLKTPVSERSERIGVFPVPPGHGPRRGSCRGDKKGCHLRVTAFFYVCRRWSLENTPPAIAQEEGRIQVFSGKERYYPSGNSGGGWTAM